MQQVLPHCKVASSIHEAFQLHGYENYERCIKREASSEQSYMSAVPSEVIRDIIKYTMWTNKDNTVIEKLGYEKVRKTAMTKVKVQNQVEKFTVKVGNT